MLINVVELKAKKKLKTILDFIYSYLDGVFSYIW